MPSQPQSPVIDHVGIVVSCIENAVVEWQNLFGYRRCSEIVTNRRQKVRVAFLSKENSVTIKLLEPSEPSSSIALLARRGGGLHHICFQCDDLRTELSLLQQKGARLTVPPEPGEAFCNHDIAFLSIGNNVNIELIDTAEKQGLKSPEID